MQQSLQRENEVKSSSNGIVVSFAMTHTPGLMDKLDLPPKSQVNSILSASQELKKEIELKSPDVLIGFVNDHFDMHSLHNMPAFSIGVSDNHMGPTVFAQEWLQMERREYPGHYELSKEIYCQAVNEGFDLTRMGPCEFNHNVLAPKRFAWPNLDIPIVPIFINCFAPPFPKLKRCYALGQFVRKVIHSRRNEKVGIFASGGLSHSPPLLTVDEEESNKGNDRLSQRILQFQTYGVKALENDPTLKTDLMQKEKEMGQSDIDLINPDWDKAVLDAVVEGDYEYFFSMSPESILEQGGGGGYEIATWVALMGTMDSEPCRLLLFEVVKEWIGSVAFVTYS